MKKVILGRTGISTTVAGLGCGGFSRIGLAKYGEAHAAGIARKAYDLGIRFFDTATAYGTEAAVGKGLQGLPRDSYVISTKFPLSDGWRENYKQKFADTLNDSLRLLGTDYIDVYNIHGAPPPGKGYEDVRDLLIPELIKARDAGKIRFPGVTEGFYTDTKHEMLNAALDDDFFDVIMIGYNILNQSAVNTIFPKTIKNNIGVLNMFAVRHALSDPTHLKTIIGKILENGQGGAGLTADENALDFLLAPGKDGIPVANSIMEAAYRFCAHTDGVHIVLTGTGSEKHLEDNIHSINSGALPVDIIEKLKQYFEKTDCVSGQI